MSQSTAMEELRHELLDDVSAHAKEVAKNHGLDDEVAEQIGFAVADRLAENWGGQLINIPKNHLYKLAQRDLEIYNKFNGRNYAALAREYKMGVRGMYKLIERVHKRESARTQPDLFS